MSRVEQGFLIAGIAGLACCAAGLSLDARAMLGAWLAATIIALGLPLGALTILMVHGLTGGRWGDAVREPLRAMAAMLPLTLIFLVPGLARLSFVFPWAGTNAAALPETVREKVAYLNVPFFLLRFAGCAAIWLALTSMVLGSTNARSSAGANVGRKYAFGLIVHALTVSVFAVDWMLSLEPEFTSTIYALYEAAAEVVGAFALAIVVLAVRRAVDVVPGGEEHVALSEDLANMLLGFVLTWVYLAFMQWLVIWGGDLPDEIHWYVVRSDNGWQYLLWLLIALHGVAFAGLLSRRLKRSHTDLVWLAGVALAGHFADGLWRVRPPLLAGSFFALWYDVAAWVALTGLWLALFLFSFVGQIGSPGGSGRPPVAKVNRHPETRDVWPRTLLAFGGGLLLLIALAAIGIKLAFNTTPTWLPFSTNSNSESPDLQRAPRQDLAAFRAEEDRQLRTLGWVDRNVGIARIPIDDAMWAVVGNGLPDWSQQGAGATGAENCAVVAATVPRAPQAQNCQRPSGAGQ
ncbi:hypothetical protein ACVDG5_000230 [Mesorhizobium sp. ORM6]